MSERFTQWSLFFFAISTLISQSAMDAFATLFALGFIWMALEQRSLGPGFRTLNWGIIVEGAYLKKVPLHRKLNQAIGHASEAEFVGRADKELATQRGQGAAAAARMLEEETLSGRAVGLKKISTDLGLSGAEVQAAEVAHAVADGGNTIVMGTDGFAQLGGVVAAMIKNRPQPGTPPAQLPAPPTQK